MSISINDKIAYQNALNEDLGQIAGTKISFMGTGEVKKFEMK